VYFFRHQWRLFNILNCTRRLQLKFSYEKISLKLVRNHPKSKGSSGSLFTIGVFFYLEYCIWLPKLWTGIIPHHLKGIVPRYFLIYFFCINQLHLGTWFTGYKLFPIVSKFFELFKFYNFSPLNPTTQIKKILWGRMVLTNFLTGIGVLLLKCDFNLGKLSL
jgi:hypothetical protein